MVIERLEKYDQDKYCRVTRCNKEIFVEAETGYDFSGVFHGEGDVKVQTVQACDNILTLLRAAGSSVKALCKISIYVADAKDTKTALDVVAEKFGEAKPAMSCFSVDLEEEKMLVKLDAEAYAE